MIASALAETPMPSTYTLGVPFTPRVTAIAVTYSAHARYLPAMTHEPNASSSPLRSPSWTSSSSFRPSLPSGGWLS
jgi:hypothetical protein